MIQQQENLYQRTKRAVVRFIQGTNLTEIIADNMVRQMTELMASQVLEAAQCYAKCLQLNPNAHAGNDSPFDPMGLDIGTATGSKNNLDLATFYPEQVLADERHAAANSSGPPPKITPSLQCQ